MGGSVGGLTAALFLRDAGCDVQVYERSMTPLEDRGAGIVVHPASVRYLARNRPAEVDRVTAMAQWFRYLNRDGTTAHQEPCRYRFTSYYALHRALLMCFDPDRYHLGQEVTGFDQEEHEVTVRLASGSTERCDLLVCADGINSSARRILLPEVRPRYAGYIAWRGTVGEGELTPGTFATLHEAITYFVMPHSHILSYPIPSREGALDPGKRLTNWVWYHNVPEGRKLESLLTDRQGVTHEFALPPGSAQERYLEELREATMSDLPPPFAEMVNKTPTPFVQVIIDIEAPRMAFGRVCLMGDAAFALRPHIAAGTAKAAEDAWKLAEAVRTCGGDVIEALERWEPGQLALGRRAIARARQAGNRSQFDCTWRAGDPLPFGLYEVGDSSLPIGPGPILSTPTAA